MTDAQAKLSPQPLRPDQGLAKGDFPLIEVGYFELNRNPENVFAEVDSAFSPATMCRASSYSTSAKTFSDSG